MEWRCSECGEIVGDGDMVGYFINGEGRYIAGSLGFWHCNPSCGRMAEHNAGSGMPRDTHIEEFKKRMASFLALYIYEANTEEFRHDCARFLLQCLAAGYDEIYPFIDEIKNSGIIESNLPGKLLWNNEIDAALEWKNSNKF